MRTGQPFRSLLLTASLWAAGCGAAPASNTVASVEPPQATVVVGGTVELVGSAAGYVDARDSGILGRLHHLPVSGDPRAVLLAAGPGDPD